MSFVSIDDALEKIMLATVDSQVSVFRTGQIGKLNAVFSSTVETQKWKQAIPGSFVGDFHRGIDQEVIRDRLESAVLR